MQENIDELHLAVFGSIIPGIPSALDQVDVAATNRNQTVVEYYTSCVNGQGSSQGAVTSSLESETGMYYKKCLVKSYSEFYKVDSTFI